jgi:hypothetical protein
LTFEIVKKGERSILVLKEHRMGMANYSSALSSVSAGGIMKHASSLTGIEKSKIVPVQAVKDTREAEV